MSSFRPRNGSSDCTGICNKLRPLRLSKCLTNSRSVASTWPSVSVSNLFSSPIVFISEMVLSRPTHPWRVSSRNLASLPNNVVLNVIGPHAHRVCRLLSDATGDKSIGPCAIMRSVCKFLRFVSSTNEGNWSLPILSSFRFCCSLSGPKSVIRVPRMSRDSNDSSRGKEEISETSVSPISSSLRLVNAAKNSILRIREKCNERTLQVGHSRKW